MRAVVELAQRMRAQGTAFIVVSHYLQMIESLQPDQCCAWTRAALPRPAAWSWPAALPKPALPALRLKGAAMSHLGHHPSASPAANPRLDCPQERSLSPPAATGLAETWLGTEPAAVASTQDCKSPCKTARPACKRSARSALNAAERATLFARPAPQGEARPPSPGRTVRLCGQGAAHPGPPPPGPMPPLCACTFTTRPQPPWMRPPWCGRGPRGPAARCCTRTAAAADLQQITQNLHMHIRVGEAAALQHLHRRCAHRRPLGAHAKSCRRRRRRALPPGPVR